MIMTLLGGILETAEKFKLVLMMSLEGRLKSAKKGMKPLETSYY
jgi:hypothetical protein